MEDPRLWIRVLCGAVLGGMAGLFFHLWMQARNKVQALLYDLEHWQGYCKDRNHLLGS